MKKVLHGLINVLLRILRVLQDVGQGCLERPLRQIFQIDFRVGKGARHAQFRIQGSHRGFLG